MTKQALLIIGSSSHVLNKYEPTKVYDKIFISTRSQLQANTENSTSNAELFNLDLCTTVDFKPFFRVSYYDALDVIFASYNPTGLRDSDSIENIAKGIRANCIFPLKFFAHLCNDFPNSAINSVFISSIYAHVSPNYSNYSDSEINPLLWRI